METRKAVEVLIVEDNPYDVELTLKALERNNLSNKVFVVRDGAEALDFLFSSGRYSDRGVCENPKVVFLDLKLPKVDGLEVLRALRSDDRTKYLPIVVLTSSKQERDIVESYRLGVNSYIVKPVDFEKFVNAVSEVGMYWLILNEAPC